MFDPLAGADPRQDAGFIAVQLRWNDRQDGLSYDLFRGESEIRRFASGLMFRRETALRPFLSTNLRELRRGESIWNAIAVDFTAAISNRAAYSVIRFLERP